MGVVRGGQVRPLRAGVTMLELLARSGGDLVAAAEAAGDDRAAARGIETVHLLAPLPRPATVRDFMTFESHVAGVRGPDRPVPDQWYEAPAFYFTNPDAVLGPADPVPVPPGCELFDLELEVAAVIGREVADPTPEEAETAIAGYTILIDWSARDVQWAEMQVGLGPAKGKDGATTLGPVLVTADEVARWRSGTSFALEMEALVNGAPIGGDSLDSMAYSFGDMVAYAARGTRVRPGDVLGSGTCGGGCLAELWGRQGFGAHPPLRPGDEVTVRVEALGAMTLHVVGGVAPVPVGPARRGRPRS
ncbi:MAG: fumarylacetoacetate hydrolase family protein [Acidobacteriota bacterium]|nr:fumarylacetoacetate hydrolase family protein [Acidobacteriota bacterium]